MTKKSRIIALPGILVAIMIIFSCTKNKTADHPGPFDSRVVHPEWTESAVLYEVNIRQFTKESSFLAFTEHLPRLKELGVDILWFMPIHPIGKENRKGELGSYYSVMDYMDVNPEFGTMEDFSTLLSSAHEMGFHVIIDWVPNHTSFDNQLLADHPEWYDRDEDGELVSPYDWTDVVQLDWSKAEVQDYMLDALKFWVELGVDGFRVDHPHKTPPEFWERARPELWKIRPVLLLAENESQTRFLEEGFDMNYAWELHHLMNELTAGRIGLKTIRKYFSREGKTYPRNVYRLQFLTNHDENSWNGTISERLGEAHEALAVFMFTIPGVPLLYNGQEACLDKRLEFFEPDPIDWKECDFTELYTKLIRMKKENPALWNGESGGTVEWIKTSRARQVLAYSREKDNNAVVSILNLSKKPVRTRTDLSRLAGDYTNPLTGESVTLPLDDPLELDAWGHLLLVKK